MISTVYRHCSSISWIKTGKVYPFRLLILYWGERSSDMATIMRRPQPKKTGLAAFFAVPDQSRGILVTSILSLPRREACPASS